jgi:glycosyltransferase involved in cell wall biosynthesis
MKVSIIIPILNEKHNIKKLSKLILRSLKGLNYEIIFLDDNSLMGNLI